MKNIDDIDWKEFGKVYNDKSRTLQEVGAAIGISDRSVRRLAARIKQAKAHGDHLAPLLINRATPMSEDESRYRPDFTAEDCVEELRRVAELDPEMFVTRNYFRNHSLISESTWTRHFGSFDEFKRQAGITPSRPVKGLERHIAKHASVDHYRAMAVSRMDYAARYERDASGRFQTMIVASDLHDEEIDPFFLRVFLNTCRRVQPDQIVLVGDVLDLPEFGKYNVDPRDWDVVRRIKFVHQNILEPLREFCPNTQIDWIEGNHEARMLKHLADASPAMRAVLSDLHGFTVGKLFGLDRFEINYIAQADLAAFTKRDHEKEIARNYKIYHDAVLCHHFPHARNMGLPGVNGHHHRHQVWPMYSPLYGAYEWHQLGCGHKRVASYCEGEAWHLGFAIVNVDTYTKATAFDYIPVTDFAVSGGKFCYREQGEGPSNSLIKTLH